MKILVAVKGLDSGQKARLDHVLAGQGVTFADALASGEERRSAVAAAEIVFGNVPAPWLSEAVGLRWVQLDSAGADAYLGLNLGRPEPVPLTNLGDFYGRAVSEAALAGILAFHRQLPRLLAAQRERRWVKHEVEPAIGRLHGARVVILGAGSIGGRLAGLLGAFECPVRCFARRSPLAVLRTAAELDAALPTADILVNTLPHSPETIGFIDARRLGLLPPSSLLVNMGRGSALDETALLAALDAGRLAGAVLDVTAGEPLPRGSPLWAHPAVILTQHTGGRFPGETDGKIDVFAANFRRFLQGYPLENLVPTARGGAMAP
jgi:phosphoglycerate dehydrogenase-like enzyme